MAQCHLLERQKEKKTVSRARGLRDFRLALELLGYGVCNIFNTDLGGLRRPFDSPLHRRLQGDAGVTISEAHQHVVDHRMYQSMALLLQAAADTLETYQEIGKSQMCSSYPLCTRDIQHWNNQLVQSMYS
jgi:hypothetical protein